MNKSNFLLFLLFCANMLFAQIAIDTVGVDKQAIVDITTPNKAVLFPRIDSIMHKADISFLKENLPEAIPEGLLVYNNSMLQSSLGKGYYYWVNGKWNQLIDDDSVYSNLHIDKVSNTQTSSPIYIKDFFTNDIDLPIASYNDNLIIENGFKWIGLEGLDYTFEITNQNYSNVFVKVSGIGQYPPSDYSNLILGMNLGVFLQKIDGDNNEFKLQGISATNLDNIRNSNCHLFSYNIQVPIGELPLGVYRIKSFVSGNRNYNNEEQITDKWITVGGKSLSNNLSSNMDCQNSSNDQLIARQTVVISKTQN